jgi:diguanylate cyclase (GGDEF)-like protein
LHGFRSINETLGIAVGDELLKQVAARLTEAIAEPATVARINADCFALAVAAPGREADIAHLLQNRVFRALEEPFVIAGQELRVPAKVGVAVHPGDGGDAEMLCINAEAALRSAKQSGDRCLFYARQMNARVAEKLKLENRLQMALREEQFVLHYQPRVEIATGRVIGLEALIRWASPERGLIPPSEFIPLLEETGMILHVGPWALRRAAADHAAWRDRGLTPPRIAVNVSAAQMRQKDFVETVRAAVAAGGDDTGCIDIELTESIVMEDVESNIRKLGEIRAAGMRIAIDDFGTGYSSLSYLVRLPVDELKIDHSFVSLMHASPERMAIVSTVISLAHSLRLKVTAEGVETEEQRNLLRLLKCDGMQGYLFSKPLPSRELIELLLEGEAPSRSRPGSEC